MASDPQAPNTKGFLVEIVWKGERKYQLALVIKITKQGYTH
jgi:hypothetical protein